MPKWMKIVLGVLLLLMVLGGIAAAFAVRWARENFAALRSEAAVIDADARRFAQGKDAEACVVEALRRADACDGVMCEAKARVFLSRCLVVTGVPPQLCAGIPSGITARARWQAEACAARGRANDPRCMQILGAVADHCRQP